MPNDAQLEEAKEYLDKMYELNNHATEILLFTTNEIEKARKTIEELKKKDGGNR